MALLAEWPGTLILEGKDPDLYPGFAGQLAETIERFAAQDRVIVVSFDHQWLAEFHAAMPEVRLGRLGLWSPPTPPAQATSYVSVYWLSVILDPTLIWRMHAAGERLGVWTVNDLRLMGLLLWLGVDSITTDHPERWQQVQDGGHNLVDSSWETTQLTPIY